MLPWQSVKSLNFDRDFHNTNIDSKNKAKMTIYIVPVSNGVFLELVSYILSIVGQ